MINERFPIYEAVPLGSPESMAEYIQERRADGINRFQLKVGNNPLEDVARTRASVEAGDEDTVIVADSNGGWSLASAKLAIQGLAGLPVYVEQPCRTTADCILAHRGSALPWFLMNQLSVRMKYFVQNTKQTQCLSTLSSGNWVD